MIFKLALPTRHQNVIDRCCEVLDEPVLGRWNTSIELVCRDLDIQEEVAPELVCQFLYEFGLFRRRSRLHSCGIYQQGGRWEMFIKGMSTGSLNNGTITLYTNPFGADGLARTFLHEIGHLLFTEQFIWERMTPAAHAYFRNQLATDYPYVRACIDQHKFGMRFEETLLHENLAEYFSLYFWNRIDKKAENALADDRELVIHFEAVFLEAMSAHV